MTIGFLVMAAACMAWGSLSDCFGPRPVALTGSAVLAASLALASRAGSPVEFQLLFGLLVGAATAAVFAPMMACVTGWFDTQRGLAASCSTMRLPMEANRRKRIVFSNKSRPIRLRWRRPRERFLDLCGRKRREKERHDDWKR